MLNEILTERAAEEDLAQILELQKSAYQSEAQIWNDYTIQPLTQTLDGIKEDYNNQVILKIVYGGSIIGSVRAYEKEGVCYIGKVIVHPDYQNRGIGKILMRAIEEHFSKCSRYSLFTGQKSARNLYFYGKLGYVVKREEKISCTITLVYLEKENSRKAEIQCSG